MASGCFLPGWTAHLQCLGLFDLQAGHQPAGLLPGDRLYPVPAAGPPEMPLDTAVQPFIQQAHAVRLPYKYPDPATPFPTEQISGHGIRLCMEQILNDAAKAINRTAHICVATDYVNVRFYGNVTSHSRPPVMSRVFSYRAASITPESRNVTPCTSISIKEPDV